MLCPLARIAINGAALVIKIPPSTQLIWSNKCRPAVIAMYMTDQTEMGRPWDRGAEPKSQVRAQEFQVPQPLATASANFTLVGNDPIFLLGTEL